jgi:hypothetical protein
MKMILDAAGFGAGLPLESGREAIRDPQSNGAARAERHPGRGLRRLPMAAWSAYDLTTFVQNAPLMVSETIRVLQSIEGARAPLAEIHAVLPARMVERGSTRGSSPRRKPVQ